MLNNDLKIASLLDHFTYENLKYECKLIKLNLNKWEEIITNEKPDLIFVESVWGSYQNLTKHCQKKDKTTKNIFDWSKKNNIPTIFWNKEDPLSFKTFINIAKNFDYIFTTDAKCIPRYIKNVEHENVFVLPFAAQPKLHNPINKNKEKLNTVAFAGTWYANYFPQRQKNMEILFDPAIEYGLDIYDRCFNSKIKCYEYPDKYKPYIKGHIPYKKMGPTYKKYKVFLNVNTIRESPTMLARRVFEILACGINLISSYSLSIKDMFSDIVKISNIKYDTSKYLELLMTNKELGERLSLLGQREIFNKHTYTHRIETILDKTGLSPKKKEDPGVSIISCLESPIYLDNIINNYTGQNYEKKELIIVTNNLDKNLKKKLNKLHKHLEISIIQNIKNRSDDEFINGVANYVKYNYLSIFTEHYYYAPDFTGDLMNTFKYADAGIVGKYTHYSYLEKDKLLVVKFPDKEYQYVNKLISSAIIFKKELVGKIHYSKKEDIGFIDYIENTIKLYAADRFNFVSIVKQSSNQNLNDNIIEIDGYHKAHITV